MSDPYTTHGGAITLFLAGLTQIDQKKGEAYQIALIDAFSTPDGLKALELLEKSILLSQPPLGVEDRALREIHGQRHLVAEIKRIVKHGRRSRKA